jgi:hypothetical protein
MKRPENCGDGNLIHPAKAITENGSYDKELSDDVAQQIKVTLTGGFFLWG